MLSSILRNNTQHISTSVRPQLTQRLYSTTKKTSGVVNAAAMLAMASMGFGAYYTIVKQREGHTKPRRKDTTTYEEEEARKQKKIAEKLTEKKSEP